MGAPKGNKNAAGSHSGTGGKMTKYGKVGSKKWTKAFNKAARPKIVGAKNLKGSKRGRRSYLK
jgi:hypothetical protein